MVGIYTQERCYFVFTEVGMKIVDRIRDCWITWRTGKTRDQREYETWCEHMIYHSADRIRDVFANFKHIITVDPNKFFDPREPSAWVPCQEARQYLWPVRPLGENCVWSIERVMRSPGTDSEWQRNEFGGEDRVFVATNSGKDAIIIAMRWA